METLALSNEEVQAITASYSALLALVPLAPIRDEPQYNKAIETLSRLQHAGALDEQHPLVDVFHTLSLLIQEYETEHFAADAVEGSEMLRFLMEQHNLADTDLPEIGAAARVRDILEGRVELDVAQMRALGVRFGLPASVFLE